MNNKHINTCEFLNICQTDCNGTLEDTEMCHCYELYKQLKRKEQECEELKEDRERWKSNFNGKVSAIEELLKQLDQLKKSNEELKNIIKSLQNK